MAASCAPGFADICSAEAGAVGATIRGINVRDLKRVRIPVPPARPQSEIAAFCEAENLLVTHPRVADAAVIGIPNADLGEEVKAVVQPADGIEPGPELERELLAFCRDHLAHYKCPRTVDFEAELPRLPTGKLYKRLLRDRYWGESRSRIV